MIFSWEILKIAEVIKKSIFLVKFCLNPIFQKLIYIYSVAIPILCKINKNSGLYWTYMKQYYLRFLYWNIQVIWQWLRTCEAKWHDYTINKLLSCKFSNILLFISGILMVNMTFYNKMSNDFIIHDKDIILLMLVIDKFCRYTVDSAFIGFYNR